ncbi:hypothetical protein Hypma_001991 [Hypsizygus marmoreus]|uniref:Cytochrome P450 n=1 Tax=Hypsizygus marmoreus TaxID=39966 RepID=A0A369J7G5_HYPMA|nr:hypothetical protein Hypma_001991 [Hypsizygus marmoreus]
MANTVVQVVGVLSIVWPVYWVLRRFLARTTLDNIPGPTSDSLFIGNLAMMFDRNAWRTHRVIEEKYGSVMKFHGVLGEKQLYVSDPKALYHIFIKDYENYVEPEAFYVTNGLHFGKGIFNYQGDMHRKQRKLLSPAFSISHMRQMSPIFYEVTNKVKAAFAKKVSKGPQEVQSRLAYFILRFTYVQIEVLNWMTRTALELIGQAGLGFSFDTLTDADEGSRYAKAVKELFPTEAPLLPAAVYLLPLAVKIGTPEFRRFVVDSIPWKKLHQVRDTIDIMHEYAMKIYAEKKQAFLDGDESFISKQVGGGKDVISTLIRANMSPTAKERISDSEVIGMIFAAMDTTSSALARTLHTLATHAGAQDRLRHEISQAMGDQNELTYDVLGELPFLDAVCKETMRLTTTNMILPLSRPIIGMDGTQLNEVLIPANTSLYTSVLSSNRNPVIWGPDSYEWKPERWLNPLPQTLVDAPIPGIYPHLMTFLGGPHSCLGFTFAQLEMKVVLSVLIKNFKFAPSSKNDDLIWETPGISSPSLIVDGEKVSQLPLVVSAVHLA